MGDGVQTIYMGHHKGCHLWWAFLHFLAGLLPTALWPNSFGVGESGLAQLKLTSSQLVHK